jgi:RHS repeat-associated protein
LTRSEYDAFGLQTGGNGSSNSIGYTGQRLDNETGLMALGNGERYYSPNYARFIQQDSWLGNSSMPQSLNRFSYVYNNPFKYHDPSGNLPEYLTQENPDEKRLAVIAKGFQDWENKISQSNDSDNLKWAKIFAKTAKTFLRPTFVPNRRDSKFL